MKKLIVVLCLLFAGCVTATPRDALIGLPPEIRQSMVENGLLSATGTRNSSACRYGSPERGFFNIHSNRGYTTTEYSSSNGSGWSVSTDNGRITGWSLNK